MKGKVFKEVYQIVKKIPKGKVATYGQIAYVFNQKTKRTKISPQLVGFALHKNKDPKKVSCHRVVDRRGRIALNYGFGGAEEQKRKLEEEGIKFKDKMHVDLDKHLIGRKSLFDASRKQKPVGRG